VPRDRYWLRPGPRGLAFLAKLAGPADAIPQVEGLNRALDLGAGRPFTVAGWYAVTGVNPTPPFMLSSARPAVELLAPSGNLSNNGQVSARLVTGRGKEVVLEAPAPAEGMTGRWGRWYHLALVRHPDGAVELYDNGVLAARKQDATTGEAITADRLIAGGYPHRELNAGHPFGGWVDEVCVYGRGLTAAEVARLAGR
jgi:hypothetical protein